MSYVIRPVRPGDVQPIYEMAKSTGGGFTNLPPDKRSLAAKLELAAKGFARKADAPGVDLFMFALENVKTGQVSGTCQIFAMVGQKWPFYSYRIGSLTQHSKELDRTFRADILNLSTDLEGATEVGGLYLHPSARSGGLGMLIARSRYLFIRNHRNRFTDTTLAELRGVIDEAGSSPFWDGVANKFFGMNFQDADEFNAKHGNQFIADLMPSHPVYIAMLPEAAKAVIGIPHPSGRAAMRMLENEGFAWEKYIDIFDGGPTMTVKTDNIATIKNARDSKIAGIDESLGENAGGEKVLLCSGKLADWRAGYGWIEEKGSGIVLDAISASALALQQGDPVSYVPRN